MRDLVTLLPMLDEMSILSLTGPASASTLNPKPGTLNPKLKPETRLSHTGPALTRPSVLYLHAI